MATVFQENHLDFQKKSEIQNAIIGTGTVSVQGEIARNDTDNRIELFLNGNTEQVAHLSDIETLSGAAVASGNLKADDATMLELKDADGNVISTVNLLPAVESDLAAIASGTLDNATGIITFTREDNSTFTLDLSALLAVEVIDALDSTETGQALSANQGRVLSERIENDVVPVVNAKADQDDVQTALTALDKDTITESAQVTLAAGETKDVPTTYTPTLVTKMRVLKSGQEVQGAQTGTDSEAKITSLVGGTFDVVVTYKFDPAAEGTAVTLGASDTVA